MPLTHSRARCFSRQPRLIATSPNKFTPKCLGPFAITAVISSGNTMKLDLPPTIRLATHDEERPDTFNDKQSQNAERKTGNGRGPGTTAVKPDNN